MVELSIRTQSSNSLDDLVAAAARDDQESCEYLAVERDVVTAVRTLDEDNRLPTAEHFNQEVIREVVLVLDELPVPRCSIERLEPDALCAFLGHGKVDIVSEVHEQAIGAKSLNLGPQRGLH